MPLKMKSKFIRPLILGFSQKNSIIHDRNSILVHPVEIPN